MIGINRRFSGRSGCVFPLIGGLFFLIGLVLLAIAWRQMLQEQAYQSGQCTIIAKQLLHEVSVSSNTNGTGNTTFKTTTTTEVYAASFEYTVRAADGRSSTASGYDGSNSYTSDRFGQQAVVDRYNVGQSYQCWYDAKNLAQAVLVRQPNWVLIFIGAGFALFGALFVVIGIIALLSRSRT